MMKIYNYSIYNNTKENLFFSLMEIQNKLFISSNINDLKNFFDLLDNNECAISWLKSRPRGNFKIHDLNNNSKINNVIVIIPTIDSNNNNSNECKNIGRVQFLNAIRD